MGWTPKRRTFPGTEENTVYLPSLLHALPCSPGLGGRVPILLLAFLACGALPAPWCQSQVFGGSSGHFLGPEHLGEPRGYCLHLPV